MRKKTINTIPLDIIKKISLEIKERQNINNILALLQKITSYYDLINFKFDEQKFIRARKCESANGFENISDIYYPPPHLTNNGRANDKNCPALYLSLTPFTALAEIDAKVGDFVQIGVFKPKDGTTLRLGLIGEILRTHRGGGCINSELQNHLNTFLNNISRENKPAAISYIFLDAVLDDIMTDANAIENDYTFSRTLTRVLLERNQQVDGLLYHSDKNKYAYNIALPSFVADEKIELARSIVVRIKDRFEYGLFDFDVEKEVRKINSSGRVEWKEHQ